jgi:hypothetical protein
MFGATASLREFIDLFRRRWNDPEAKILVPKSVEAAFADPQSDEEREAKQLIDLFRTQQATKFERELFKQRRRLADAERTLTMKTTKAATDSKRIASEKVGWLLGKLSALHSAELTEDDLRIFPGHYAPVMVMENGRRVVRPMRYLCRPPGKPAHWDAKYPGTYNARRDNLGGEWTAPGQPNLLSFAAITDEPPAEIAAAGHDRCVIPIQPEHVESWLNPDPQNLAAIYAILDDRERPYYEHRLAA